jgi:RNA polymerase sigma factor (sigma-70 family)
MARRPVEGRGVGSDPERFVDSLSPDLLAGIRRRIRWTAALRGVSLQEDAVDDLAQDLLLRLWERERGVPSEVEDFPAYALRAASNLTVDVLRRHRTKKRTAPTSTTDGGAVLGVPWPLTPEQIAIGRDSLRHELAECRRLLSERQYQMFALIYLAGFSPREVSKRVGLSPGNVHALLSGLRRALGGRGVVLRTRASRSGRGS